MGREAGLFFFVYICVLKLIFGFYFSLGFTFFCTFFSSFCISLFIFLFFFLLFFFLLFIYLMMIERVSWPYFDRRYSAPTYLICSICVSEAWNEDLKRYVIN